MREAIKLRTCLISGLIACIFAYFLPEIVFTFKGSGGGPGYLPVLVVFPALVVGLLAVVARNLGGQTWCAVVRVLVYAVLAAVPTLIVAPFAVGIWAGLGYAVVAAGAFAIGASVNEQLREKPAVGFVAGLLAGLAVFFVSTHFILPPFVSLFTAEAFVPGVGLTVRLMAPSAVAFSVARWVFAWEGAMAPKVFFSSMLVTLSTFAAGAFVAGLVTSLYYYATPENDMEIIWPGVPEHLVPFSPDRHKEDRARMELFYRGLPESKAGVPWYNRSLPDDFDAEKGDLAEALDGPLAERSWLRRRIPKSAGGESRRAVWESWAGPLFWWTMLFACLYGAQFCMAGMLRKQWVENEQLMFPHVEAVAESVSPPRPGLFKSSYFWMGAGVCFVIYTLEGLHYHFPAFPRIELFGSPLHQLSLAEVFSQHPWSSMKKILSVQPYIICIAFLLTTELSFSVWFFAVVDNLIRLATSYARLPQPWSQAINHYWINSGSDQMGAVIVLVLFLVWMSRRELATIFKRALYDSEPVDRDEFIPYRVCVFGFVLSTLGVLAWCVYARMNPLVSVFFFGAFYILLIFTSRLVSELGLVTARIGYNTPHLLFVRLFGYNHQTMLSTFSVNTFLWAPLFTNSAHTCPVALTCFKLTGEAGRGKRLFAGYLYVLAVASAALFFLAAVRYAYVHGALNTDREGYYSATKWIFENTYLRDLVFKDRAHAPDPTEISAMFIGGGMMAFLLIMRRLFYWWPLHPLGYVAMSIDGIWFSFLLGWLAKRAVLKYGGGEALPRAKEFFLGLFAGQFFMAGFWYVIGCLAKDATIGFI